MKNIPIRRKLMMVNLLTSGIVLLATCIAFTTYEVISLRHGLIQGYMIRAEIVAANSTASVAFQNESDAATTLGAFRIDPRIIAACIYDRTGKIFATYPTNAPPQMFPAATGTSGYRGGHLEIFAPIAQENQQLGIVFLETDLSALTSIFEGYAALSLLIIIGAIALAYLLSRILQKQISRPVLALAETANAVARQGDFSVRAKKFGDDELGLLTDAFNQMLSEIHKLNATLEQRVQERTAQLEAANKELEAFSYSVSHDLRAPLRHIDGFVRMLREDYEKNLPEEGRRYLQIVSDAARRMGALIDDLLVFSRMGRSELQRSPVKMDSLVQEVLRDMAPEFQGRNLEWDIGPLPEINCDAAMLKQVWVNLISNAVKYSRDRSPAKIKIRCRENETGEYEFYVQDNGAGFDMRYADKLFGVFQRLHQNEEFEGTGIGLANVRRIVSRHGGRTWAEAEIDKGATIHFTLPKKNMEK
jgi:signal transduction histidine kinase